MAGILGSKWGQHTGRHFSCLVCGKEFYRLPSQIANGATKTCSDACKSTYQSGAGNSFWQKTHSPETRQKISAGRKGKGLGNQTAKGHQHTSEAREKIRVASKQRWQDHRQKMLDALPRGEDHWWNKLAMVRRYRMEWTPRQRREWKEQCCIWCASTEHLVLDHIVPLVLGGGRYRENCQTLCHTCNLWKLHFIEKPMYLSLQIAKGALITNPA